jgi:hypothetical protein
MQAEVIIAGFGDKGFDGQILAFAGMTKGSHLMPSDGPEMRGGTRTAPSSLPTKRSARPPFVIPRPPWS